MPHGTRRLRVILALALPALLASAGPAAAQGQTRQYHLAAEEVTWDYAPSRKALIHGYGPSDGIPRPWAGNTRKRKVRYVEYTDSSFTTRKPQPEWLGILGPIIHAEVSDTVVVHFLNRAKGRYGIHPHGLRYTKEHEGAFYPSAGAEAAIPPGGRFVYMWTEPVETNLGLLGPMIITARGRAHPDATPADVDREFVLLFMIFNENPPGGRKSAA